jgi:hypothetical protein
MLVIIIKIPRTDPMDKEFRTEHEDWWEFFSFSKGLKFYLK